MLIITADDYGKNQKATDNILKCFSSGRITSASTMVFMEDSKRAAKLALSAGLEIGLHLNFTLPFNAFDIPANLREHQKRVKKYLTKHKICPFIYNPFLTESFDLLFRGQNEEFMRLYGRMPNYYNGHHHMHLCANMLVGKLIPYGARVRKTFTFEQSEKNAVNRLYRKILNSWISKRFLSTNCFYSIQPIQNHQRLQNIINRAEIENIEIGVHPEKREEYEFLLSEPYQNIIGCVQKGRFQHLQNN